MIYFSQIRAGLIASALLLTTALASPAFAETLPEISPRQIASDIEVRTNPQSGAREFIAPSFDPFEEDRTMAGTASLRSVSNGTTIDGQSLRGGALLDMTFYYNSASNDPYDTRGYEEAVYLSGEYAPVTYRDNRILECNEHVQDVVYYHEDYYRPSLYVNLFRPYRFYSGHYAYGGGYNYGRGFVGSSRFVGSRGFRNRNVRSRRNIRDRRNTRQNNRGGIANRIVDGVRRTNAQREDRSGTREERRANRNRNSDSRETRRANRAERRNERAAATRASTPRQDRAPRVRNNRIRNNRIRNNNAASTSARRVAPRAATPSQATATATAAPTSRPQRAERAAPASRGDRAAPARRARNTERSRPARAERVRSRDAQRAKSRNSPRRNGGSKGRSRGNSKLKLMSFLPMASAWSRNVVRNVDVQCAREEILSVHIPQERLDAARFDGLTVLVLDRTGAEVPVFIPPNYIEGFRQAVSGRVTPNVSYQEPGISGSVPRDPIYQEPRPYGIEEAQCPAGTTKQNDGTCLQGGATTYGGYPTR